jgi:hypothetical protein
LNLNLNEKMEKDMKKLTKLIMTMLILLFIINLLEAQTTTSRFVRIIRNAAGTPQTGLDVDLYAAGGGKVYDLSESGTNPGEYYHTAVAQGRYDLYVGGLIRQANIWVGASKVTTVVDLFDADGSVMDADTLEWPHGVQQTRPFNFGGHYLNAIDFDSLAPAFDSLATQDTCCLYIPAGRWVISDSLVLRYLRGGAAYWGIHGEYGATVIEARTGCFDSLKNMLNVITSGLTSSTDSIIAHLEINGIIWDFNGEGGSSRDWNIASGDSGYHALRTYRDDNWDRYNPGAAADTTMEGQILWSDSQGLILHTIGRIIHFSITNCSFEDSYYGAVRMRPYYFQNGWLASVEGGELTNCQFRQIRGPAIANLWNGIKTISNNYFRWVGVAYYNGTGGNTFSHNRIEEYDSCGVYLDYANWITVTDNIISEGAQSFIICNGNVTGIIGKNTLLNPWADDSHLGVGQLNDSLLAAIKFETTFDDSSAFPRGLVIANNTLRTSDSRYDGKMKYFIGSRSEIADSVRGNVFVNNIINYGLGTDAVLGFTNVSLLENIVFPNMMTKNSRDQSDSLWFARIDTIGAGRWLKILLPSGDYHYAAKDTTTYVKHLVTSGITATNPGVQGDSPLTTALNEVSTVANANDAVTLPSAVAGLEITIINNGANQLEIWPASGDNAGGGVDTAVTLAAGSNVTYVAYDATNWEIK